MTAKRTEWAAKNKYNSFNSYKGLAYYEHYKKIADWLEGKGELPSPIECSLDPITACNHRCYYCNSQRYVRHSPNDLPNALSPTLSWGEMYDLVSLLSDWGVKGLCLGGGGESTLNNDAIVMIGIAHQKGMEVSLVTNGSMLYDGFLREELMRCRWVGVSMDASNKEEYKKIHGVNTFESTIKNVKRLTDLKRERKSNVDIAFKFLVLPENVNSISKACGLAKELGVDDFHVRPVDLERKDYKMARKLNFDMPKVLNEFERCHELEDDKFHVYTIMHKYDENFHVKHDFNKCLASPLVIQVCTDRQCYVCVDHRQEDRFRLGSLENIKEWWGSDKHRELVEGINPHKECSRCTWSEYNRQIEETVFQDKLCLSFP